MSTDENVVHGTITVKLIDKTSGDVVHEETVNNLITDAGDLYQATRVASGVNTNGIAQPTLVNGMKLGTGTTAAAKNGAGAALVTYLTGSNDLLDVGYPQVVNLGASNGVNVVYRCTWDAGTATSSAISEVVLVTDAGSNATSAAGSTIARAIFGTAINKTASEALEITWNHKQLGA